MVVLFLGMVLLAVFSRALVTTPSGLAWTSIAVLILLVIEMLTLMGIRLPSSLLNSPVSASS